MNKYFVIIPLLLFSAAFAGCKASYTKSNVEGSVQELIKKEYGLDGRAKLEGETLYLEVKLEGLVSTEQKVLADILKKVQGAALVITRVSLSSDAKIKFMVLVVSEPTFKLHLRIIQKLDDIKAFLYQKISRADYEERLILEIESNEPQGDALNNEMEKTGELSMNEFVGRLIISQINMLSRSNPFLGVMLGNTQLNYVDLKEHELTAGLSKNISDTLLPFFENIVNTQTLKIEKKYEGFGPKKIRLIGENGQNILIDVKPGSAKPKS